MAKLERSYNVPLRHEWLKSPKYKRAKKAGIALSQFIAKHMKVPEKNVKIGMELNKKLWTRGIRNPPHHVKVNVVKDDKGVVKADLFAVEKPASKKEKKEVKTESKKAKVEQPQAEQ